MPTSAPTTRPGLRRTTDKSGTASNAHGVLARLADRLQGCIGPERRAALVAEAVDDRVAAIAPEILPCHLDARRCLTALVFGEVEQPLDLLHGLGLVPSPDH